MEAGMTDAIRLVLKRYWGHDGFWPLQEEAMRCVLAGRDSIVVLPTGGGKSLCFRAPAMVKPQLTLVASPLLSLLKDQLDTLFDNGITATHSTSRFDSSLPCLSFIVPCWEGQNPRL